MLIGYARVSTQDQNLDMQIEALTKAGCKKVFKDKISGSRAERPGLIKAQESLREGDTLVVWKLDRLGRSVKNLVDLVGELHHEGVQFKSLTDAIDTGSASGRFFFHVMASWLRWNGNSASSGPVQASKSRVGSDEKAAANDR
jgi:DNA invertase Pin-like site-specific DNA recombinase